MATIDSGNPYQSRPNEPKATNGLGITGFVLSLLGIVTCGTLNLISLPLSVTALLWKPRGFAIAGTLISVVSIGAYALAGLLLMTTFQIGKTLLTEGEKIYDTHTAISDATTRIERYRSEHDSLPDGIEGNRLVIESKDGWDTELRYEVEGGTYVIRSAGPDKQFNTSDDLTSKESKVETNLQIDAGGGDTDGPVIIPSDPPSDATPPADDGAATPEKTDDSGAEKTDE